MKRHNPIYITINTNRTTSTNNISIGNSRSSLPRKNRIIPTTDLKIHKKQRRKSQPECKRHEKRCEVTPYLDFQKEIDEKKRVFLTKKIKKTG